MKKLICAVAALAMTGAAAMAANVNEASGEFDNGSIKWEYWNETTTQEGLLLHYFPNWRMTYDPALTEAPAAATLTYSLVKEGQTEAVMSGTLNPSGGLNANTTTYYIDAAYLAAGNYTMNATFSLTKAGEEAVDYELPAQNFEVVEQAALKYDIEFTHVDEVTANSITVNYEFKSLNNEVLPDENVYHVELGISGFPNQTSTSKSGSITFEGLQPNTTYMIWANNPRMVYEGQTYNTNFPNWEVTTADGVSTVPTAKLEYNSVHGTAQKNASFDYTITLENIDEANVTSVRVWLDAPGNVTKGEATTLSGSIPVDVTNGNVTLWAKAEITFKDGDTEKTINTIPNDFGVDFIKDETPSEDMPIISIRAFDPVGLTSTTGRVSYEITTDKPELEGVTYNVWCVMKGEVVLGRLEGLTELSGTLELSNLPEKANTEIWVKAEAVNKDGAKSTTAQYPGENEGYTGLFVNTIDTGVAAIEVAADAEAVYFNMQGVRVAQPANGIFIMVKNGKANKVMVK